MRSLYFIVGIICFAVVEVKSKCNSDSLALYRLVFTTEWSKEKFPKQYPLWRPHAQWSPTVGMTHDSNYCFWKPEKTVNYGLKLFLQKGHLNEIIKGDEMSNKNFVFDMFMAPAINSGCGTTEINFFADGNHSLISIVSKLIPSPDWFVGVHSLDLCQGDNWMDKIIVDGDLFDGGVENGYTFTAPKWATDPPAPVARITSRQPNHPANSFYYPNLPRLPRIGYFEISKLREYGMRRTFSSNYLQDQMEVSPPAASNNDDEDSNNDMPNAISPITSSVAQSGFVAQNDSFTRLSKRTRRKHRRYHRRQQKIKYLTTSRPSPQTDKPTDCTWSKWSACTGSDGKEVAKSCFLRDGLMTRHYLSKDGKPCRPPSETIQCTLKKPSYCKYGLSRPNTLTKYYSW